MWIYMFVCPKFNFPRTAKLWNSVPIAYFPLTYDLSGFKSRINRQKNSSYVKYQSVNKAQYNFFNPNFLVLNFFFVVYKSKR